MTQLASLCASYCRGARAAGGRKPGPCRRQGPENLLRQVRAGEFVPVELAVVILVERGEGFHEFGRRHGLSLADAAVVILVERLEGRLRPRDTAAGCAGRRR